MSDTAEMTPGDDPIGERLRTAVLAGVHALTYATTVAVAVLVGSFVVGIATGGGFVRVKTATFLAGLVLMAYATARLWPSSPSDLEPDGTAGVTAAGSVPAVHDRTRFQRFVRALPPARWLPAPPPNSRITPEGKLFVGSVLVLLASYLLETRFGVV